MALAPRTSYDADAWTWSAALAGIGGWHGALLGGLPGDDWQRTRGRGGLLAGAALGGLTAAVVSQWYRPAIADTGEALIYSAFGNGLGLGVGLLLDPGGRQTSARLMQGVGLATAVGGTLLAPRWEHGLAETPLTLAAAGTGAVSGYFVSELWRRDHNDAPEGRRRFGGALAGGALGVLAAGPLAQRFALSWGDSAELLFAYGGGGTFGYGLGGLIDPAALRLQTTLQLGGAAVASGAALWLRDRTHYSGTDVAFGVLGAAIGAWHGQLGSRWATEAQGLDVPAPVTRSRARFASLMAGGLGLLGAMGLAQVVEYEPGDLVEVGAGAVVGNLMGLGVGVALRHDPDGRHRVLAQQVAGLGLTGVAVALSPHTAYHAADVTTLSAGALFGLSLGTWAPGNWRDLPSTRERLGAGLAGAGAGLVTGAAMTQWRGLEVGEAVGLFAATGTLLLVGDGSTQLVLGSRSPRTRNRAASGIAAGLGAGLGVAVPYLRLDEVVPAAVPAGALMGGLAGVWLPEIIPGPAGRRHRRIAGVEMGMPLGALTAGLLSPRLRYEVADLAELSVAMLAGNLTGFAGGCLLDARDCLSAERGRAPAIGAEAMGFGILGVALATASRTSYGPADYLYMSVATAGGGVYGGLIGDSADRRARDARIFGAGLGLLGGAATASALHLSPAATFEASAEAVLASLFVDSAVTLTGIHDRDAAHLRRQRRLYGSLAGLGAFAGGSYLSTRTAYSGSDAALTMLMSGLGGWGGFRLAGLDVDLSVRRTQTTTAGAVLGGFAGMLTSQFLELDSTTLVFATGGALAGNLLGWSLGQLAGTPHARADLSAAAMTAGGMTLALGGAMFGDRLAVGASNAGMISLVGAFGAWHGGWLSRTWSRTPVEASPIVGGSMLGGGVGLLTGAAFASQLTYAPADVAESAMGFVAANSFGAGLGLAFGPKDDDRLAVGLMEGFGVLGTVVMASFAPRTEFRGEDWVLGVLATGHGVWQGVGSARLLKVDDPRRLAGGTMITTAVGGIAGAVASQHFHLTLAETLAGFSGTLWGAWLGAWTGVIWGDRLKIDAAGVSMAGSDVGLTLSALAVSRIGNMPPAQVGTINLIGAGGALAGAAVGVLIPTAKNVQKGTLFGTAAGLAAGVVITEILDLSLTPGSPGASAGASGGTFTGPWRWPAWLPSVDVAMPVVGPPLPVNPDWPVPDTGLSVGLQGMWH
ncbi:MAG: hypothetical protein HY903_08915 [Deltaproteobacteria bacterium]|nr:hypothetical protein [Deltaproteobacteria bacterium]